MPSRYHHASAKTTTSISRDLLNVVAPWLKCKGAVRQLAPEYVYRAISEHRPGMFKRTFGESNTNRNGTPYIVDPLFWA
jgi:hypothetical protein